MALQNDAVSCCAVGVKHSGDPLGKLIKINDKIDAYLATPPEDAAKKHPGKAVLFLPDVIGIWQNSKLLADQLAANGYLTLIPDLFDGDPVPLGSPPDFVARWFKEGTNGDKPHGNEEMDPVVIAAIQTLKNDYSINRIAAVGYCIGGKYVIRHYKSGIDVGYVAHPSKVTHEEFASIGGPLSIAAPEFDSQYTAKLRHESEDILAKTGHPWQINLFSGVVHGFAIRGNMEKRHERFTKEQAFYQAVAWFNEFL
jgi:dienelactone hydrolase